MKKYFFVLMVILLSACNKPKTFEETVYFENLIWNRFQIIEHEFNIENTEKLYDLKLQFMHTFAYHTDHILMNITLYFPTGGFRSKDYEFRLQNDELQWMVEPKDNIYKHELTVLQGIRFPEAGIQKIRIENKMTKFNLTDVVGVGFSVEETSKK